MEKRKEYDDILDCPRCGSDYLDLSLAPTTVECLSCGLEFALKQVAVWEE